MSKAHPPELKKFMDKKLSSELSSNVHPNLLIPKDDNFSLVFVKLEEVRLHPVVNLLQTPTVSLGIGSLKLNGGRHVQGILRGFDPFMNLVMDDCLEMAPGGQQNTIGMVVIRGNSIIMLEALERV